MRNGLRTGIVALLLLLMSCNWLAAAEGESPTPIAAADYPRVDGSTSALPLQRWIACTLFDVPCTWQEWMAAPPPTERGIVPDPAYMTPPPFMPEAAASARAARAETITAIWHSGTHGAYMQLISRGADFILVAREPSEDELLAAEDAGVTLDARPIALDAFVLLVHADNPVDSLSVATVRDIYTGDITTWTELGIVIDPEYPDAEPIHTYQRNPNSGSQELMESLVMQGEPMIESPDMILETMMGPIHAIGGGGDLFGGEEDPWGIGYSVYYYASFMFPHERVRLAAIDGVPPTSENIANRTYPLTTEVYAVVRGDTPPDSAAVALRDWLLTDEGQAAVAGSGYIPIR
jgi:phosphate transport system substrate-binding protein